MVPITYNFWIIALSAFVTATGCVASLSLARRLHNSTGHRLRVNLACVATMLGATIWVAHFIGMMALEFPFPVIYDLQLTLISSLISIIVVGIALYVVASKRNSNVRIALGGVILGSGFALMHYVGMEAFQSNFCGIVYDTKWITLSVLLFILIAFFGGLARLQERSAPYSVGCLAAHDLHQRGALYCDVRIEFRAKRCRNLVLDANSAQRNHGNRRVACGIRHHRIRLVGGGA